MPLSEKAIQEFKQIYKEEFNEDLSDQEAFEMATNLMELFKVIYRPIPNDNIKNSD